MLFFWSSALDTLYPDWHCVYSNVFSNAFDEWIGFRKIHKWIFSACCELVPNAFPARRSTRIYRRKFRTWSLRLDAISCVFSARMDSRIKSSCEIQKKQTVPWMLCRRARKCMISTRHGSWCVLSAGDCCWRLFRRIRKFRRNRFGASSSNVAPSRVKFHTF